MQAACGVRDAGGKLCSDLGVSLLWYMRLQPSVAVKVDCSGRLTADIESASYPQNAVGWLQAGLENEATRPPASPNICAA